MLMTGASKLPTGHEFAARRVSNGHILAENQTS